MYEATWSLLFKLLELLFNSSCERCGALLIVILFFLQHLELGVPLGGGGAAQEEYCYNHETFVLHETLVLHCVRGTVEWSMCVLFRYANARNHETVVVHCMHTVQLINELVFWIIP